MSLYRKIDDWFLGFKTRSVRAKDTGFSVPKSKHRGNTRIPLKSGSGLANLTAAAKKHPEVMVKIPKRLSRNSNGMQGIRNHLDYISRNGKITVENHSGEKLNGKKALESQLEDWQKLNIPERGKHREALNIVLSMPAGTPPQAVLNAARNFAAEQFADHQYLFALHHESEKEGEPEHPHVHLCVLMRDTYGQRLNPRKNDLFEWRVRFAEKLREEGVECAATKRQHRGKILKAENGIVRAMKERGATPRIEKQRLEELNQAIKNLERPTHPYIQKVMQTRGYILAEYGLIAKELYKMGHKNEARLISRLAKDMVGQPLSTKAQREYDQKVSPQVQQEPHISKQTGIEQDNEPTR